MAITTVAAYLPGTQETAEAASGWSYGLDCNYWGFSSENTKLSQFSDHFGVEKGNNEMYLLDVLNGYRAKDNKFESFEGSELKGVKFESKNTDILTIDSKTGKINAKKTGTALVKITWNKATLYGAIEVISSSEMKTYRDEHKTALSYAKKILKACGSKLTTSGALKAQKIRLQMLSEQEEGSYELIGSVWDKDICKSVVYSMDALNAQTKINEVDTYLGERNPFSTSGSYKFKISSLSGSDKTVTATLSKAVSKDQMAGAKYDSWELSKMSGKSYTLAVALRDTKTNKFIDATATFTTGSKKVTIKCKSKLTKGRKYELMRNNYSDWGITDWTGSDSDWLRDDWIHNGTYTFTAK
jgi:hypothetical protein